MHPVGALIFITIMLKNSNLFNFFMEDDFGSRYLEEFSNNWISSGEESGCFNRRFSKLIEVVSLEKIPFLVYIRERISNQQFKDFEYRKRGNLEEIIPEAFKKFEDQKNGGFLESIGVFIENGKFVFSVNQKYYKHFLK